MICRHGCLIPFSYNVKFFILKISQFRNIEYSFIILELTNLAAVFLSESK